MRTFSLLALSLSTLAFAAACEEDKGAAEAAPAAAADSAAAPAAEAAKVKYTEVSVDDVDKWLKGGEKVAVYDANGEATRKKHGIIPGAVLLDSSSQYNTAAVLPAEKDKKLVFYCGSTQCSASDTAAERACDAGYENVTVLRAGISGWKDAGKDTVAFEAAGAAPAEAPAEAAEDTKKAG